MNPRTYSHQTTPQLPALACRTCPHAQELMRWIADIERRIAKLEAAERTRTRRDAEQERRLLLLELRHGGEVLL